MTFSQQGSWALFSSASGGDLLALGLIQGGGSPLQTEGPHTPSLYAGTVTVQAFAFPFRPLGRHDPGVGGADLPIACPLQSPHGHLHLNPTLTMKQVVAPVVSSHQGHLGTEVTKPSQPSQGTHGTETPSPQRDAGRTLWVSSHCPPPNQGPLYRVHTSLGEGSIALATYLVVHLLRAVEDVHHGAQGSSQVLGCLSLARASGACRGSAHDQVKGLRECDVAPAEDLQSPGAP